MALFNDPSVWRESNQWKAVFGPTAIGDANSQLVANFGSLDENSSQRPDLSEIVARIAELFAMDVYSELKNDIPTQFRGSQTSQGNRDLASRAIPPQRTPVVTPHNSRRVPRIGHVPGPNRDRSLSAF
jgi:hypothetical protein